MADKLEVEIEYSNRHIHITKDLFEKLYGPEYELTMKNKLSQSDDFASNETVMIMGPKGKIENVRILGPYRDKTQVEILKSDTYILGIDTPIKLSGDLDNTPGIKIVGPINEVDLESGLIIAKRHLHISPDEAEEMNLKDGQKIKLELTGDRALIFDEIVVRIGEGFVKKIHLDLDEANAANIKQNTKGNIIL
ncbi:MAG: phosphate propanoyltransferase [Patescibacteria group bacterium]|nr:phosphate propanoyltransferase [Patescibacteria group bacterium]MDD4304845.1 phosphate propanoyltransferase [Patescibacteria group bacterium]MDD4695818.1 phosphate propanoyltransferase [Patescibacteria group bacterium]